MPRVDQLNHLLADPITSPVDVLVGDPAQCRIRGVAEDSRKVRTGDLFVARRGLRTEGARFVRNAIDAGAVAVLGTAEVVRDLPAGVVGLVSGDPADAGAHLAFRFHDHPERRLRLVGVTGTNGKTTVTTLARQLACDVLAPTGSIGTVEVHDGRTARPAAMTTPGRIELAAELGAIAEAGATHVMLEVSSHALDQGRVSDLRFTVGVFTNLTGDHLDYHGSMDAYEDAKASLFSSLDPAGVAISNLDDPAGSRMLSRSPARRVGITMDPKRSAAALDGRVLVERIDEHPDGMRIRILGSGLFTEEIQADLPLVGRHNAFNVAAAVAVVWSLGGHSDAMTRAIEGIQAPAGRLEPVHGPEDDVSVFVDYAHTDDALRTVLQAVRPNVPPTGALWAVFGAGGDRDTSKRPRMMRAALDGADHVVVTSDNPRTEDPASIVADVVAGATPGESSRIHTCVDRQEAITAAVRTAPSGTVIVIAGKGHEDYQIVGTERRDFDDRKIAASALRSRRDGHR